MALGALLEASGAEQMYSWAALGGSKRSFKTGFSDLGVQKAPKTEPKTTSKRGPKAIRAESGNFTKVEHSTKDLLDF